MIDFSYRDPETGVAEINSVNIQADRIAPPMRGQSFALKATSGGAVFHAGEPNMDDDIILGKPWRGANDIPFGLLSELATTTTVITVVTPPTVTFVKNSPILIADSIDIADGLDSGDCEWRIPSTVTYSTTTTYTGKTWTLTVAATTGSYLKGAIVAQPTVGKTRISSMGIGKDGTRQYGLRAQVEAPDKPTITLTATSSSTATCSVILPSNNLLFAQHARVYAFTTAAAAQLGPLPNQRYDGILSFNGTTTASVAITSYGGGANYGGGTLASGTRYYFVALLTSDTSDWPEMIGEPSLVGTVALP